MNIRTTLTPKTFRCTPLHPSVQTSGAGQAHKVSPRPLEQLETHTFLSGCVVDMFSLTHTPTHTQTCTNTHTHTHLGPYYEYLWCCVLEKKALD